MAVLVDPATGESLGIDVRDVGAGLPVAFSVPYAITDIQPEQGLRRDRRGRRRGPDVAQCRRASRSSPRATRRAGVQVVVTQVAVAAPSPSRHAGPAHRAPAPAPDRGRSDDSNLLWIIILIAVIAAIAAFLIARGRNSTDEFPPPPTDGEAAAGEAAAGMPTRLTAPRPPSRAGRPGRRRPPAAGRPRRPPRRTARRRVMTGDPTPERGRVAFLGLGTMGAAMAANLARAGFTVTGWNRTPGRADELADLGVVMAPTAAEAVADAASWSSASRTRRTSRRSCSAPTASSTARDPGRSIVDCSTIAPSGSWDFAARLAERELRMVDAPVSGGSEGARNATLTIFVGGDEADVERARPVLTAMGRTITHVGPIGAGQAVKAVNQVILAGAYLGVAEGIVLAIKAGLDVEQVVGALGGGAAQSWVLANRSGRMLDNEYPLGFKVALHRKDLGHRPRPGGAARRRPARQRPRRPARDRPHRRRPRRRRHVRPGPRDPGPVRARVLSRADSRAPSRGRPATSDRPACRCSAGGTGPRCTS